jgi:hypothetical protein
VPADAGAVNVKALEVVVTPLAVAAWVPLDEQAVGDVV